MSLYDTYLTSPFDPQIDQLGWYDQDLISLIFSNGAAALDFATAATASVIIEAQSSATLGFLTSGTLDVAIAATSAVTIDFATEFSAAFLSSSISAESAVTIDFSTAFVGVIPPQISVAINTSGILSQPPTHNEATIAGVSVDIGAIIAIPIGSGQIVSA